MIPGTQVTLGVIVLCSSAGSSNFAISARSVARSWARCSLNPYNHLQYKKELVMLYRGRNTSSSPTRERDRPRVPKLWRATENVCGLRIQAVWGKNNTPRDPELSSAKNLDRRFKPSPRKDDSREGNRPSFPPSQSDQILHKFSRFPSEIAFLWFSLIGSHDISHAPTSAR